MNAKTQEELSLNDLQRMLSGRKTQLDRLLRKKAALEKKLSDLTQQISSVQGRPVVAGRQGAVRGMGRPQNERTLKQTVLDLLAQNKKGYGIDELSKKVLETGYKTNSTNFKNTLYQCLYNTATIAHDKKTGLYRLT